MFWDKFIDCVDVYKNSSFEGFLFSFRKTPNRSKLVIVLTTVRSEIPQYTAKFLLRAMLYRSRCQPYQIIQIEQSFVCPLALRTAHIYFARLQHTHALNLIS